jgi:hypothetical protein
MTTSKRRSKLYVAVLIFSWSPITIGLSPNTAVAQSSLPPCQSYPNTDWTGCIGTYTYPDGRKYVGEWRNGSRNGHGTMTWPDGAKYVGDWRDDDLNGQGTYTFRDGRKYVGGFRDSRYNGKGAFSYPDGAKYVGEFRDGKENGKGTYRFPNGEKYVGDLDGKRQDILIEAVPGLHRMAILADTKATRSPQLQALQDAARARGVEVSIHRVASAEEITATIDTAKASAAAALNVLSSPLLYGNRQLIMDRVAVLRLPAIYPWVEEGEEGGFLAYGPRIVQIFRELLTQQLVKLLRGVKPADIPIEQPTKFELVINLKTANAMGVTVPATLVARADKVIE